MTTLGFLSWACAGLNAASVVSIDAVANTSNVTREKFGSIPEASLLGSGRAFPGEDGGNASCRAGGCRRTAPAVYANPADIRKKPLGVRVLDKSSIDPSRRDRSVLKSAFTYAGAYVGNGNHGESADAPAGHA